MCCPSYQVAAAVEAQDAVDLLVACQPAAVGWEACWDNLVVASCQGSPAPSCEDDGRAALASQVACFPLASDHQASSCGAVDLHIDDHTCQDACPVASCQDDQDGAHAWAFHPVPWAWTPEAYCPCVAPWKKKSEGQMVPLPFLWVAVAETAAARIVAVELDCFAAAGCSTAEETWVSLDPEPKETADYSCQLGLAAVKVDHLAAQA